MSETTQTVSRDEFVQRFIARMNRDEKPEEWPWNENYARTIAQGFWEDEHLKLGYSPEEAAEAEMVFLEAERRR